MGSEHILKFQVGISSNNTDIIMSAFSHDDAKAISIPRVFSKDSGADKSYE